MIIPLLPFAIFTAGITIYSTFFYENNYCPKEWMFPNVELKVQIENCELKMIGRNIKIWDVKNDAIEKYEQLQIEKRLKNF
tara:strand:+ start:388 stop:630 length:243 start_codon:yes stop_codon:yes gene_type:complete